MCEQPAPRMNTLIDRLIFDSQDGLEPNPVFPVLLAAKVVW